MNTEVKKKKMNLPIYEGEDFVLYKIGGKYYFFLSYNDKKKKQFLCRQMWSALHRISKSLKSRDPIQITFEKVKMEDKSIAYDLYLHEISFDTKGAGEKLYTGKDDVAFIKARRLMQENEEKLASLKSGILESIKKDMVVIL